MTYHDSCSGCASSTSATSRAGCAKVKGLKVAEMKDAVCCGFGGTFCVKYSEISNDMVRKKIANVTASGAEVLLAGDLGA